MRSHSIQCAPQGSMKPAANGPHNIQRSDGELYDFESGGEFGLFGDDGVPLQQHSSYSSVSSGEKEVFAIGSSHLKADLGQKNKQNKRPRKNKIWNEMEKDLFLKGLELFGENWRKISKFIATKTMNQVKLYHKTWAETANVIPDSVNLANDSSIYLPLESNDETRYFTTECTNTINFLDKSMHKGTSLTVKSRFPNSSADSHASGSETDRDTSRMNFGEGIVVSSLHDWNLGSQVSVTEESPVDSPLGPLSIICERKTVKPRRIVRGNDPKIPRRKKDSRSKVKKKGRKRPPLLTTKPKYKDSTQNIIGSPKTVHINEGQIIRLNKNESEDSDVNIDDSESEKSAFFSDDLITNKAENFVREAEESNESQRDERSNQSNVGQVNNKEFQNLLEKERNFYLDASKFRDNMTQVKYISIRNRIIKEWEKCKPSTLTKEQITNEFRLIGHDVAYEIYDYLEENGLINLKQDIAEKLAERVLSRRKRSRQERLLNAEKLRLDIIKKGGGVTISHDASGAVIDALHIPDSVPSNRANEGRRSAALRYLKLVNCLKYDPSSPAPFSIVIHPQAIIALDLHCHSSLSEVIGLLGGFLNPSPATLYVSTVVPTEASSSGVDCEMCPLSQMKAVELIRKRGMEVVGWYHSHPSFLPNPSQRDLDTQAQLQNWFKRNNAPFIGVIVSPFLPTTDSESSKIRCFLLDVPPRHRAEGVATKDVRDADVPYRLHWKVLQRSEWKREEIQQSIQDILRKSKDHSSPVNWRQHWKGGLSYLDKFIASLKLLLPHDASELVCLSHDAIIALVT